MSQRPLRVVAAPTVIAAGFATAALGASAPLSVNQYRTQASAICTNEEKQLNAYQARGSSAAKKLVDEVEFESRTKLASYRAFARLRPPSQFAQLNTRMLADLRVLLQAWPATIAAAKRGPAAYGRGSFETSKERKAGNDLAAVWKKLAIPFCNH